MFDCIIINDQEDSLELLATFVNQTSLLNLKETFLSPVKAIEYVKENSVDLIFLDVIMPQISGIEFATLLDGYYSPLQGPNVIFSSAHREFAVESYDFQRCKGYLLKPYAYSKFIMFVQRMEIQEARKISAFHKEENRQLILKRRRKKVVIKLEEILYITGNKNSVIVSLKNGQDERFYMTFYQIEKCLPKELFVRIHKSHIVAINKIQSMSNNSIRLHNMRVIFPIGNTYRSYVHQIAQRTAMIRAF